MGANFCGFQHRPSPKRSPKQDSDIQNCGLTASSVIKLFKRRSSCAALQKARKLHFHYRQEKQELRPCKNKDNSNFLTLEDWIISSPGFSITNNSCTNISGVDMHAPKQSSRKIHPSFDGDLKEELLPKSGPGKSLTFSVEISMKAYEEVAHGNLMQTEISSSFCTTNTTGKMKKKVSFSSPEVAEIFVLDGSPEIYVKH